MHAELRDEMTEAFLRVYDKGEFIRSSECDAFEHEFSAYCGANYAVGVASGLDALALALRALRVGPGDEVILPANTFIATALAVSAVGAEIVLVDPDPDTCNMTVETFLDAVSERTKAVIPVHLYGQAADIEAIAREAGALGIYVVEDCAQAHGARYSGQHVGTFGDVGCFSFYPGKNLGALGDGGAIVTNDEGVAARVRELSNYGSRQKYHHVEKGVNSRLDEIQAAFLRVKLAHLGEHIAARQAIANRYLTEIANPKIKLPKLGENRNHVWHIFAVQCGERDALKEHLQACEIGTNCHYPITVADQEAYSEENLGATELARSLAAGVLSLPLFVGMTNEQISEVIQRVNEF